MIFGISSFSQQDITNICLQEQQGAKTSTGVLKLTFFFSFIPHPSECFHPGTCIGGKPCNQKEAFCMTLEEKCFWSIVTAPEFILWASGSWKLLGLIENLVSLQFQVKTWTSAEIFLLTAAIQRPGSEVRPQRTSVMCYLFLLLEMRPPSLHASFSRPPSSFALCPPLSSHTWKWSA